MGLYFSPLLSSWLGFQFDVNIPTVFFFSWPSPYFKVSRIARFLNKSIFYGIWCFLKKKPDQEKAFDRVNRSFLLHLLVAVGFGPHSCRVFSELQSLLMRKRKGLFLVSTQLFLTVAGKGTMSRSCKFIIGAMSRCGEFEETAQKIWKTNKNSHAAV